MNYLCPVCGYDRLEFPPEDHMICPACGTQFGYHDANRSHAELRRLWLAHGARWHDPYTPPPPGWDPYRQVQQLIDRVAAQD